MSDEELIKKVAVKAVAMGAAYLFLGPAGLLVGLFGGEGG